MALQLDLTLPIATISEGNCYEHWQKKSERHRKQKAYIKALWPRMAIRLPCTIMLTRIAPRLLDDDNVVFAFKWIRDAVAECIFPDKGPGLADNDPRIKFAYDQRKGKSGINIRIEDAGD